MSRARNREISEKKSEQGYEDISDQVSIVESEGRDEDGESIGEMVVAGKSATDTDLLLSSLLPREMNIPIITITKETVTKYHSRPFSAPATSAAMATDLPPVGATKGEEGERQRSTQVEVHGRKTTDEVKDYVKGRFSSKVAGQVTSKVTSIVADKVKDILTGKVAGKITAMVRDKSKDEAPTTFQSNLSEPWIEATSAAQDRSGGLDDYGQGQKLPSAELITLSNPGLPSIVLPEVATGAKKKTSDFPQPFYSTLGRYKPHEPGDEAFAPITLTMTFDADEEKRHSLKRPTVMIRKIVPDEKPGSRTALKLPPPLPGRGGGGGGRTEDGKLTVPSGEADTEGENESVLSSGMMQSVVSIMKYLSQNSAQARASQDLASPTPGSEAEISSVADVHGQEHQELQEHHQQTTVLEPSVPMTEAEMEALRLSVRTMMGLQRWKKKANARLRHKAGPHITVRTFAKNAQHRTLLQKNLEEIVTELPLPLKRMLHDEAFPILNDILQAYERTLGKNNPLTEQAKVKIQSMTKFMKTYDEM